MQLESRIYVCGHQGMVGSALVRSLRNYGYTNIITVTRKNLDLKDNQKTETFFKDNKPEYVFLAAAVVGGIKANLNNPASFLADNLLIQHNVIYSSHLVGAKKICMLGSSCIYPKESSQPIKEEYLMTGPLEPTNEGYAIAKIAGIKLAQYYEKQFGLKSINPIPCNLYGPNDSFDLQNSHVLSALVRKFIDAKENNFPSVLLWGSGIAKREFLHVNDLADILIYLMNNYDSSEIINIGSGVDITIKNLALLIAEKTRYKGGVIWDNKSPDGMLRKCLDVSKMRALGLAPKIKLSQGIDGMISEYYKFKNEQIN